MQELQILRDRRQELVQKREQLCKQYEDLDAQALSEAILQVETRGQEGKDALWQGVCRLLGRNKAFFRSIEFVRFLNISGSTGHYILKRMEQKGVILHVGWGKWSLNEDEHCTQYHETLGSLYERAREMFLMERALAAQIVELENEIEALESLIHQVKSIEGVCS